MFADTKVEVTPLIRNFLEVRASVNFCIVRWSQVCRTADKLSVISQEVIQRDDKGRASIIQRITADNNTSYYQVNRNEAGGVESMTRVNVTT